MMTVSCVSSGVCCIAVYKIMETGIKLHAMGTKVSVFSPTGKIWRCIFFFSSRRRHTRCSRDWSSDVCSSDLQLALYAPDVEKIYNDIKSLASPKVQITNAQLNRDYSGRVSARMSMLIAPEESEGDRKSVV